MADEKKEMTLAEEAGLPANWVPVDSNPIRPGAPSGGPPSGPSMDSYFAGSLPPNMQLGPDFVKTQYGGSGIPNSRLMPVGPAGNPGIVAAAQSVIAQTLSQLTLVMPKEYKVQNGTNTVVTWVPETSGTALMGPPESTTTVNLQPYINYAARATTGGVDTFVFDITPTFPNVWRNGTSYAVGDVVVDAGNNVQRVTTPGISGASTPSFSNTVGGTVTDNTVVWTCVKYAITIGDIIVVYIHLNPVGVVATHVTAITDFGSTNGYTALPLQTWASDVTTQVFYAIAKANFPVGTGFNVSASLSLTAVSASASYFTASNLQAPVTPVQNTGASVTSWSSGSKTISTGNVLFSFSGSVANNIASSPWISLVGGGAAGTTGVERIAYYSPGIGGTYSDAWTSLTSTTFASTLTAFPAATTTTGASKPGIPGFRFIINSDLVHAVFGASGVDHQVGAVPDPGATAGTTRFLCENATWAIPSVTLDVNGAAILGTVPNFNDATPAAPSGAANVKWQNDSSTPDTNISAYLPTFGASGTSHKPGGVPDPGATPGSTRFLCENASWVVVNFTPANQSMKVDSVVFSDDYWIAVDNAAPGWAYPLTVV